MYKLFLRQNWNGSKSKAMKSLVQTFRGKQANAQGEAMTGGGGEVRVKNLPKGQGPPLCYLKKTFPQKIPPP